MRASSVGIAVDSSWGRTGRPAAPPVIEQAIRPVASVVVGGGASKAGMRERGREGPGCVRRCGCASGREQFAFVAQVWGSHGSNTPRRAVGHRGPHQCRKGLRRPWNLSSGRLESCVAQSQHDLARLAIDDERKPTQWRLATRDWLSRTGGGAQVGYCRR